MLSVFPQLLFLSALSPTLLRIAAGLVLLYVAYIQWQRRETIAQMRFPFVPSGIWIVWVVVLIEAATALALITGYRMQVAALFSLLFSLKFLVWHGRYTAVFPLSRIATLLLLVISISLLVTGAGLFAFDLPL